MSEKRLLETDAKYVLNSPKEFEFKYNYLRIDNTELKADKVAKMIMDNFKI